MTEPVTPATELPYGGTVETFRTERAEVGQKLGDLRQDRFKHVFAEGGKFRGSDEMEEYELLVEAAANAWSVVALLAWVRKHYGDEAAYRAAAVAQDIGINGDPWDDSLLNTSAVSP